MRLKIVTKVLECELDYNADVSFLVSVLDRLQQLSCGVKHTLGLPHRFNFFNFADSEFLLNNGRTLSVVDKCNGLVITSPEEVCTISLTLWAALVM